MRQTLVVTILLCLLAIPAALLSDWAPAPRRVAVTQVEPRHTATAQAPSPPKPVVDFNTAAAKTRALALAEWFAIGAQRLHFLAPPSDNPVSWVTQTPKAVTHAAAGWFGAAAHALAQARPAVVGSVASGMAAVAGKTTGHEPADQNYATAVNWYSLATDPADAGARYAIGMHYLTGTDMAQDYGQAARWLMGAAERGHSRAALALADLYVQGKGLERNYAAATMWYEIAARGLPNDGTRAAALTKRDRTRAAMTAEERKIAEAAIQSWKPLSVAAAMPDQAIAGLDGP